MRNKLYKQNTISCLNIHRRVWTRLSGVTTSSFTCSWNKFMPLFKTFADARVFLNAYWNLSWSNVWLCHIYKPCNYVLVLLAMCWDWTLDWVCTALLRDLQLTVISHFSNEYSLRTSTTYKQTHNGSVLAPSLNLHLTLM